jgi:biotin synthase
MVEGISDLDMEVCCTLGMITESQAVRLAEAGLHYYNHNLDTSEEYYKEVISTRGYDDRLITLDNVRKGSLKVCSGGIIGMGESTEDRVGMLVSLSKLNPQPESVPINALVPVKGTPMAEEKIVPTWDVIRMIATTRIVMPKTTVRLSAGRTEMNSEAQALCFMAGASSIFAGEKLLTTPNPGEDKDAEMFANLGLIPTVVKKDDRGKFKIRKSLLNNEENEKWSRPRHSIERNIKASEKAKEIRQQL